jgi:hypothetical protein
MQRSVDDHADAAQADPYDPAYSAAGSRLLVYGTIATAIIAVRFRPCA